MITKYREFDDYDLDEVVTPAFEIKTPRLLPSEPPGGITYRFGASGYISKNRNPDYCVIHTEWKNVANYCHWTFCELPLLHLALARATSYCIQVVENLRKHMDLSQTYTDEKKYINRRGRRLKNEREVQEYLVRKQPEPTFTCWRG